MPKILYHKHLMINFKTFTGYHNVSKHKLTIDGSLFSSKIQVGHKILHSKLQNQSLSLSGFFRMLARNFQALWKGPRGCDCYRYYTNVVKKPGALFTTKNIFKS